MSLRRVTAQSRAKGVGAVSHARAVPDKERHEGLSSPSPSHLRHSSPPSDLEKSKMAPSKKAWIVFALASGACAAFNGVFAKLTTTELTTSIAASIATILHLGSGNHVVEYVIRALFFSLNLAFNALMWVLFTRALTLGTTTRVSIFNTSANFLITAILGLLIFREALPPLWFLGAAMLVAGNVVIGRREEEGDKIPKADLGGLSVSEIDTEEGLLASLARNEAVDERAVTCDEERT